ncbi:MAG: branched-chain amino acid ABC transporter permease [Ferrimicrobium sp.]
MRDSGNGETLGSGDVDAESTSVRSRVRGARSRRSQIFGVAGIVLPVIGFIIAPYLYSNQLLLTYMVLYVALAQGVNVIYGYAGYLPFGYFGFFGIGAYAGGLAVLDWHLPALVGVLIGGVAGALAGAILLPLFRLRGAYFAIGTLAAAEALGELVSNPSLTNITNGPYGLNLAAIYSGSMSYGAAVGLMGLTLVGVFFLARSRLGLVLRAIRDDPYSAAMAGANVARARSVAWLIAAVIAGLAGAIFGWATSVFYPSAVFDPAISVFAIVFALFGGVGSLWGPTLGAVLLYALYGAIGVSNPQEFQLIYGAIIVVLVLFAPSGLLGVGRRVGERIRARSGGSQ